ncbi:hypothetical protein BHE74_00059244 [Ensete ventricosum]|nr:hypothetical protein GW17_00056561 [Ensete ventricosum]RWW35784.1 hypothetical protein BHE74_00059244 [Ensete ventricosum]
MRSPALLHRPPPSLYIEKDRGVLPPSSSSSASCRLRSFGLWLPHRSFLLISFPSVRYVCSAISTLFLGYHFGSDSVSRARFGSRGSLDLLGLGSFGLSGMGKMVDLEEGLELVQKGITKLTNILEGRTEQSFTIGERVMLYTYASDRTSSLFLLH